MENAEKNYKVTKENTKVSKKDGGQSQTKPQVNIVTVSLRTPQVRDPVETFASTGEWVSRDEAERFYHTHPDVSDLATVQNIMDMRFTGPGESPAGG